MNNLTTRKIVLGMLMAFVLAFGVQGTVDAVTVIKTADAPGINSSSFTFDIKFTEAEANADEDGSGDDKDKSYEFSITTEPTSGVPISSITGSNVSSVDIANGQFELNPNANSEATSDVTVTVTVSYSITSSQGKFTFSANEEEVFVNYKGPITSNLNVTSIDMDPDIIATDGSISGAQSFEFTATSVKTGDRVIITPDNTSSTVTGISHSGFINVESDFTYPSLSDAVITLIATADASSKTIKVDYKVSAHGAYTFNVGSDTFTAYAVQNGAQVDQNRPDIIAHTSTTSTPQEQATGARVAISVKLNSPPTNWFKVDFGISGGKLYRSLDVNSPAVSNLSVAANDIASAYIRVDNNQTFAKVTATIPGSRHYAAAYTVTYFYGQVVLERVSGHNQFGPTNQEGFPHSREKRALPNELTVRVLDRYGSNKGVSDQWVEFNIDGGTGDTPDGTATRLTVDNSSTPFLRARSRSDLWDHDSLVNVATHDITDADDHRDPLIVKTDSNGYARVYFVPGTTAGSHTISYNVVNQTSPTSYGSTPVAEGSPNFAATVHKSISSVVQDLIINKTFPTTSPTTTLTPQTSNQLSGRHPAMKVLITESGSNAGTPDVLVNFRVTDGNAKLARYEYETPNQTTLNTVTDTTGVATVYVQVHSGSTPRVRAQIVDNNNANARHTCYIFL